MSINQIDIWSNWQNIVIEKIVGYIYYGADNIIISRLVGLVSVGLLSNYYLIVNTIQTFFVQITSPVQSALGNLINTENDSDKISDIFNKYCFLSFICSSFCAVSLLTLSVPFIKLWLGESFIMDNSVIILLSFTYFSSAMRTPLYQVSTIYGMFRQRRNISIIGSVANIAISLILVKYIGVAGTLTGTLIYDLIFWIGLTKYIIANKLKITYKEYILKVCIYIALTIFECIVVMEISKIIFNPNTLFSLVGRATLCIILPNVVNILVFWKTDELDYFKGLLVAMLNRLLPINK
jgi:O-antigen/teichoic acid export membrane protein